MSRFKTIRSRRPRAAVVVAVLAAAMSVTALQATAAVKSRPSSPASSSATQDPVTLHLLFAVDGTELEAWKSVSDLFTKKHPNVNLDIKTISSDQMTKRIKPILSGSNPSDVLMGSQGYGVDGPLVQAKLILPLDRYARKYGWTRRVSAPTLQQFRWTPDGKTFGKGSLYGLAEQLEYVAVYFNKQKLAALHLGVPDTLGRFESALAAAKTAGETPICLGNKDGWPAAHVWALLQGARVPAADVRAWIFGRKPLASNANVEALTQLRDWVDKGYFTSGYDRLKYGDQTAQFIGGGCVFQIAGTWINGDTSAAMKKNVGMFLFPSTKPGRYVAAGSTSRPLHISSKSENPDIAAAYIDFATGVEAARIFERTIGSLSLTDRRSPATPDRLQKTATRLGHILDATGGVALYPDLAAPNMPKIEYPALRKEMEGKISPQEYLKRLNAEWTRYRKSSR